MRRGRFFTAVKGDWMTKQDLCQGYHHVMIHPEMRTNFGVHYVFPGRLCDVLDLECLVPRREECSVSVHQALEAAQRLPRRQGNTKSFVD